MGIPGREGLPGRRGQRGDDGDEGLSGAMGLPGPKVSYFNYLTYSMPYQSQNINYVDIREIYL